MPTKNYAEAMLEVLSGFMEEDPNFVVMGNEVLGIGPEGAQFEPFQELYENRILFPPCSEAAYTAMAAGRGDVRAPDVRPPRARLVHLSGDLLDRQRDLHRADLLGRHDRRAGHAAHQPRPPPRWRRAALREPVRDVLEPAGDRDRRSLRRQGGQGAADDRDQVGQPDDRAHPRLRVRGRGRCPRRRLRDPLRPGRREARGRRRDHRRLLDDDLGGARRRGGAGRRGNQRRGGRPPHPGSARREDDPRLGRQDRAADRRRRGPACTAASPPRSPRW